LKNLHGQVRTTFLDVDRRISDVIPYHITEIPEAKTLPPVDIEGTLEEDRRNNRTIPRFGVRVGTDFSTDDGAFYERGNLVVWKIAIQSPGATSLNFQFSNLNLPQDAQMFIYNLAENMLIGPITTTNTHDGKFASDIVTGDVAIIEVFMRAETTGNFSIDVKGVIHGFKEAEIAPRAYGDSQSCNNNVNCSIASSWNNEKDAVALILVNGEEHCTGSLIYNDCYRGFFLTAFHCLDNGDGTLSTAEQDAVEDWVFRFRYESATCTNALPTDYLSFSGANFRAAWNTTDFALLELQDDVVGFSEIALAGWNRQATPPDANVASIHHPEGDIKKISFDDEDLDEDGTGNLWLIDQWDDGLVEPGSSGGALFDENRKIIGQLRGGDLNIGCNGSGGSLVDNNTFGKFSVSWTGGGTNATRLSNWLGGSGAPVTSSTVRVPYVQGADLLCTSNSTYSVQNSIMGSSVTWSVSPASLFASPTSGTGNSASIRAASASTSGTGTITFTISISGCTSFNITKTIWVGRPAAPTDMYMNLDSPPFTACGNTTQPFYVLDFTNNSDLTNYTWYPPSGGSVTSGQGTSFVNISLPAGPDNDYVSVVAYNTCGYSSFLDESITINNCSGGGGFRIADDDRIEIIVFPNPVKDRMRVRINPKEQMERTSGKMQGEVRLFDKVGKLLIRRAISGLENDFDISAFQSDVYLLEISIDEKKYREKIMILK